MPTFIGKEQFFAGSITVGMDVFGVQATNFREAKDFMRKKILEAGATIDEENDEHISWHHSSCSGELENKALRILN
jgi:hypothetical protein